MGTYSSLPLGTTDAWVIAVAERLNVAEMATLDRRHFTVVRPSHVDALMLVPWGITMRPRGARSPPADLTMRHVTAATEAT